MNTFTDLQLFEIARNQKRILWLLLMSILVIIGAPFIPHAPIFIVLIEAVFALIGIIGAVLIYRVANALEEPWPWLYVVCAFVPCVNTVTLLIVNVRATAALKRRGIRVGLMGVDKTDLEKLRR